MPQAIKGVFANVTGLRTQVEEARRAKGLTWAQLAEGSGWSRQYLQFALTAAAVPVEVVEFLVRKLNIRPTLDVAPAVSLLLQPETAP